MKVLATKTIAIMTRSLAVFAILAGFYSLLNINSNAYADDTKSVTASVVVPDVCTLSSTSTTHTDSVNGGTYTPNFGGESTVSVTCNDRNGYSVYAVGYSNDTEGTTTLIGASTGLTIPTGTSTSTNVSNWAMKLTPGTGTFAPTILSDTNGSFANYHVVPTTTTKVATLTSDINVSNSSQFKTSYAVAVAPTQAADTYVGKVKYTVVHPNYSNADGTRETYNIPVNFAGSGVESVTFTATGYPTRTVSTSGVTANLTAGVTYTATATFTSGYELASWALNNANYGTLSSTSTNPTTFTPNANSASAIVTTTGQEKKTYIQDLTLANCQVNVGTNGNATNIGDNITVYDRRDEKDYTVRYINGECWMTQNLRLTGGTGTLALSSTYSNVSSYTMPAESTSNFTSSTGYTTDGHKCDTDKNKGCWYNYYSVTAGTISTNSNNTAASSDICPKNWHLPTGPNTTANTDINKLVGNTTSDSQYPTTGLTAFGAVAGGIYRNGAPDYTRLGYWWSATASNTTNRYNLKYDSGYGSFSSDSYFRFGGLFVRCVRSS